MKFTSSRKRFRLATAALVVLASSTYDVEPAPAGSGEDLVCPVTSPLNAFSGDGLDEATSPAYTAGVGGKDGVVFDTSTGAGKLRLAKKGGSFRSSNVAISASIGSKQCSSSRSSAPDPVAGKPTACRSRCCWSLR